MRKSEEPLQDSGRPPLDLSVPLEHRSYDKTPMFSAMQWQRYVRQALIRDIEAEYPSTLICYVAHLQAQVDRTDVLGFVDLLHNVPNGQPIDLLLHTPGGDVDSAEKLIGMVRKKVGDDGQLRVIVPDFAKSAGTLMALGANSIVMSDCSELGPIDPQVVIPDSNGNTAVHSVLSYLIAYNEAKKAFAKTPNNPVLQLTFERFDPIIVKKFETIEKRARMFAEDLLKPRGTLYTAIVSKLMDIDQYPSHGQMIGWEAAVEMGLNVNYMAMTDPLWRKYWSLYCHLRLAIPESGQRIFESSYVSLPM
jgi:hypothetical protein